jgi:membrane protease YdiL (CAAX protease family)
MLFRGFFFTRFLKLLPASRWGVGLAVVMQALLFGLMHLYYGVSSGAVLAAIYGAVFAVIYLRSGRNLWAGIFMHGLIDTIGITLLFLRVVPA